MRRVAACALAGVVLVGCSSGGDEAATPAPAPSSPSATAAAPSDTASTPPSPAEVGTPALADPPEGDLGLWLDTIGVPVVAAVRTSTQLAQLAGATPEARAATCRQVATDLDGIGSPELLTALAITADAETATLLVGDLRAKADLLTVCLDGGGDLEARIAEVAATHAVAVAWLERLRSGT